MPCSVRTNLSMHFSDPAATSNILSTLLSIHYLKLIHSKQYFTIASNKAKHQDSPCKMDCIDSFLMTELFEMIFLYIQTIIKKLFKTPINCYTCLPNRNVSTTPPTRNVPNVEECMRSNCCYILSIALQLMYTRVEY